MLPSSRFALSLKPNVAYLVLNFCAAWKKQTTLPSLPSLAYAGIPYQSLGERVGALSLMIAWSRLPMVRSGSRISAIFASTALSPSSLSAFSSRMRSFIAPRSSSVNPLSFLLIAAAFCVPFCAVFIEFYSSSDDLIHFTSQSLAFNQLRWALVVWDCSQPLEPALREACHALATASISSSTSGSMKLQTIVDLAGL